MLHKKTVLVKKRHFYVFMLFYKSPGCKNTAFLQKYIFVKKLLFYVKNLFCCKRYFCKKAAFLDTFMFPCPLYCGAFKFPC